MILDDFFVFIPEKKVSNRLSKSIRRPLSIYLDMFISQTESLNQIFSGISSFQKESKDLCQLEPREPRLVDSITTNVEILFDAQLCRTGRSALTAIIYSRCPFRWTR